MKLYISLAFTVQVVHFFGANGNAVRGGQLYFTNSGAARKDYNALLKMRVMKIVSSIRELLISVHTD